MQKTRIGGWIVGCWIRLAERQERPGIGAIAGGARVKARIPRSPIALTEQDSVACWNPS